MLPWHEEIGQLPKMPVLSALVGAARHLSEDYNEEEEETALDLTIPAGFMFILLCSCVYCGCRERANRCLGCPEDSLCGVGSGQDGELCGSGCSILIGTIESTRGAASRVRV